MKYSINKVKTVFIHPLLSYSVLFRACLSWNSLTYSVKNCGSLLESKAKIKEQGVIGCNCLI